MAAGVIHLPRKQLTHPMELEDVVERVDFSGAGAGAVQEEGSKKRTKKNERQHRSQDPHKAQANNPEKRGSRVELPVMGLVLGGHSETEETRRRE